MIGRKIRLLQGDIQNDELGSKPRLMQVFHGDHPSIKSPSPLETVEKNISEVNERVRNVLEGKPISEKILEKYKESITGSLTAEEKQKFVLSVMADELHVLNETREKLIVNGENKKVQEEAGKLQAGIQRDITKMQVTIQKDIAHTQADTLIESTKISAKARVDAAKIANDPLTLDVNETIAYELIKKTGILNDLPAFEAKLASGNKEAHNDALTLERALKKDGKELTVDGKITEKTLIAAKGLIGENLDMISKYEDVMNHLKSKSPSSTGVKVQSTEVEKQ